MQELEKILEEIGREIAGSMGRKREGLLLAHDIVRKHMKNDGWILVEDRLPEERKEVLAQFEVRTINVKNEVIKTTYMHVMYLKGGIWKSDMGIPNGKVIAWQPLPEPYRPEI